MTNSQLLLTMLNSIQDLEINFKMALSMLVAVRLIPITSKSYHMAFQLLEN